MIGTSFYQLVNSNQNYNPRLITQICDSHRYCTKLRYKKSDSISITENDFSQGYTHIFALISLSPLDITVLHGRTYAAELLHNNQ